MTHVAQQKCQPALVHLDELVAIYLTRTPRDVGVRGSSETSSKGIRGGEDPILGRSGCRASNEKRGNSEGPLGSLGGLEPRTKDSMHPRKRSPNPDPQLKVSISGQAKHSICNSESNPIKTLAKACLKAARVRSTSWVQ